MGAHAKSETDNIHSTDYVSRNEEVQRDFIVRQDRHEVLDEKCYISINNTNYKVLNFAAFGIAIEGASDLGSHEEWHDIPFVYEGIEIGTLHLKKVKSLVNGNGTGRNAFEILGEPLHIGRILAIRSANKIISEQNKIIESYSTIPQSFRTKVYEIKDWLQELEANLDRMEYMYDKASIHDIRDFEDMVSRVIAHYLGKSFSPIYSDLMKTLNGVTEEKLPECFEFFRAKLKDMIYQAPVARRTYDKPLGYAGDYEMMNLIYREENSGESLFAKSLHRFFIDEPAAKAVRNRAKYLTKKIETYIKDNPKKKIKFLSVASGPAKEVENIILKLDSKLLENVEFHLLDQEIESLKFAQMKLNMAMHAAGKNVKVKLLNLPLKKVIQKGLPEVDYDFIYSAGLFDYFSDPVAQFAVKRLYDSLKSKGEIVIGNFCVSNPSKPVMEIVLDWKLIYRSKDDLKNLFGGISKELVVEVEDEGINLFCILRN